MPPAAVQTHVQAVYTAVPMERLHEAAATGLVPQRFVTSDPRWARVEAAALDVNELVVLAIDTAFRSGRPSLEKLWAEAVFEQVRRTANPAAPSRVDCLFAAPTLEDSLDLWAELGLVSQFGPDGVPVAGPMAIPARTRGRWVRVDMGLFGTRELTPDPSATQAGLDALVENARRYWNGEESGRPVVELLCDGLDVDGWGGYSLAPGA